MTNCRWKIRKTSSVGVRISSEPAHSSGMSVPVLPLEGAERAGHRALESGRRRARSPAGTGSTSTGTCRMPSDDSAGIDSGHVDPPEQLPRGGAVDAARPRTAPSGMFTKCARIQNTANGMYRPMSGRMIAHRVFSSPMVADLVVQRHDDALERQRQAEHEREEDPPAARRAQVAQREAGQRADEQRDRDHAELDEEARQQQLPMCADWNAVDEVRPVRASSGHESPAG